MSFWSLNSISFYLFLFLFFVFPSKVFLFSSSYNLYAKNCFLLSFFFNFLHVCDSVFFNNSMHLKIEKKVDSSQFKIIQCKAIGSFYLYVNIFSPFFFRFYPEKYVYFLWSWNLTLNQELMPITYINCLNFIELVLRFKMWNWMAYKWYRSHWIFSKGDVMTQENDILEYY